MSTAGQPASADARPHGQNVILGIGGGIAAYKSAELARLLIQAGCSVQPVMTRAATEFITPLTLASLTNRKVITGLFAPSQDSGDVLSSAIEHINVALENDLLVVAPATADLLAKFANGHADDFLSTLYLAFTGPVLIAPAMNTNMWNHPAVQANVATLRARGNHIIGPGSGELACGMVGSGRLAEPAEIAPAALALLKPQQDLAGETILITAGPTQEAIDPVRVITNRSSGKMGYALAQAAVARGARTILVSGPVNIPAPQGVELIPVVSAQQMLDAVLAQLPQASVFVGVAAVADYRPANAATQKMKKTAARLALELEPTTDILATVGARREERLVIGFAAETENVLAEARRKLETKHCDLIVANQVGQSGTGFEANDNEITLVTSYSAPRPLPKASKLTLSHQILDTLSELRLARQSR